MSATSLATLLDEARVLVCVGTGGVGKTTLSAALAAQAARRGRRALVLTIDPARRLADALGGAELGDAPCELDPHRREALGVRTPGSLHAVMLDMKRTFDGLVVRFAADETTRERILENRIYQHVSDALAGSAEYAAMEKVYQLVESGDYDLVVVDTPPAQHALDFLDAPQRLVEFLDSRLVQLLLHPAFAAGRFGFRIFQRGAQRVLQLIERVSGVAFLEDVSEFLMAFESMAGGFRDRAHRVRSMLVGPGAAFVLVSGPTRAGTDATLRFLDGLGRQGIPVRGVVVNRVRLWPEPAVPDPELLRSAESEAALARALAGAAGRAVGEDDREAARAALEGAAGYASLVELDRACSALLAARARRDGLFIQQVGELPADVGDLPALRRIGAQLVGEPSGGSEVDAAEAIGEGT